MADGAAFLDPERVALFYRWCVATEHLCLLYGMLPETKAETARLGPPPPITEADLGLLLGECGLLCGDAGDDAA